MTVFTSDEELVTQLKAGNREAFEPLYMRYRKMILRFFIRTINDRSTAEDLCQETFLKVFLNISGFRDDGAKFSSWLICIAKNCAMDHYRQNRRRGCPESLDDLLEFRDARLLKAITVENGLSPSHIYSQEVMVAISLLPPNLRTALYLVDVLGLSYKEIAERVDRPIGTVKSRIIRARRQVMEELRPGSMIRLDKFTYPCRKEVAGSV